MASRNQRVELPIADVRTPVTDEVAPPASREPAMLPFRARSWSDFERILLRYAEVVDGLRSVRIYGTPGQAQHGIDLYGSNAAGETVAYQAKNVKRFTAASLRAAVKKFNDEPPPQLGVRRLIVCTAGSTDDRKVGEELANQRRANPTLTIDLYDERALSEGLRSRPDLVRRLFGPAWQIAFCDNVGWEVPDRSPIDVLADSLVRGPLVALGLDGELTQAQALADTDPAQAAEMLGQIISRVADEGFLGTTGALRRERADLLVAAGQIDEATNLLAGLAWANRTNAGVDEDPHAKDQLQKLAEARALPVVKLFVDGINAVDGWHRLPRPDLDVVADLALQLDAAGHPLATELVLWVAETAATDRLTLRDGPLIDALHRIVMERAAAGLGDELSVRLRAAAADLGGDWTSLLRDARAGRLGARLATLVHARYGRRLYLNGQPEDAQVEYSAAVQVACQAQLGNEAADALYSLARLRRVYGPLHEELDTLPRMAADLRRQGHTSALLAGRDPADAGADELASGNLRSAFRRYRAAVRHSMIRGDIWGELIAHYRVADILLQSGESAAAVPHILWCGDGELVKKLAIPTYLDLREAILDGAHWERATALDILAAESDLVPDDHVSTYVTVALAGTSEPHRGFFGPHVSLLAWRAIASLADRLSESDAITALTLLDEYVYRGPNQSRHTDDDHIATVARIYESHPRLAPRAADHLAQMVLQDFHLGEVVRRAVRRSIDDPSLLLAALRPHASTDEAAARILDDYDEGAEESIDQVAQRVGAVLNAPPPEPGHFSFGTNLPNLAQRARHLDQQMREDLIEHCMSLAENESRPSQNRSEGMEGVLLLARSVDEATRRELFDRTMPLARLDLPPTALDRRLGAGHHPLAAFNFDMDGGALPRYALQAAARLASTPNRAKAVQDRVLLWLTGDDDDTYAVAVSLDILDPAHVTIDLAVLAEHPSQWLRQIAALLAARSTPPAADVLRVLAADDDRHVRRNVAFQLSRIAEVDEELAGDLRTTLQADASWMVRKAASTDLPLEGSSSDRPGST